MEDGPQKSTMEDKGLGQFLKKEKKRLVHFSFFVPHSTPHEHTRGYQGNVSRKNLFQNTLGTEKRSNLCQWLFANVKVYSKEPKICKIHAQNTLKSLDKL